MAIFKSFYFKDLFPKTIGTIFFALMFCFSGCQKNTNNLNVPRQVLKEYVERSFRVNSLNDKEQLMNLTTGTVRDMLSHLSDDDFRRDFLEKKRHFVDLKIKDERPLGPDGFSITYEMTYKAGPTPSDASDVITIKKHAKFLRQNSAQWLISEVQNLKTNIEHQNALSF